MNHIVLSLLIPASMLLFTSSLILEKGDFAKKELSYACTGLEIATNALASAPRETALALNHQTAVAINSIMVHSGQMVSFLIKALEQVVLYFATRYQHTLLCVLQMVIDGTVGAIGTYSQEVTNFVNQRMGEISDAANSVVGAINGEIGQVNNALAAVSIGNIFGGGSHQTFPTVSLSPITDKLSFSLPQDFAGTLHNLPASIPSPNDLEAKLTALISQPFDDLAHSISLKLQNASFAPDSVPLIPVMDSMAPIRFCDAGVFNTDWIDQFMEGLFVTTWIILLIIFILIIGISIGYSFYVFWEHSMLKSGLARTSNRLNDRELYADSNMSPLLLDFFQSVNDPFLSMFQDWLASRIGYGVVYHRLAWLAAYISHPFAILASLLGLVGLLFVQLQMWLVAAMSRVIMADLTGELTASLDVIEATLNSAVNQYVTPYVDKVNAEILVMEQGVNTLFLGGIKDAIDAVQSGVDAVFSDVDQGINTVFDAVPPLRDAIKGFETCVLGSMNHTLHTIVDAFNSQSTIQLPKMDYSLFALDSGRVLKVLDLANDITGMKKETESASTQLFQRQLDWIVTSYTKTLAFQRYTFVVILLFGLSLLIMGSLTTLLDACLPSKRPKTLSRR